MDNRLQIFNFEERGVRVVEIDGEPWFVGKDVCFIFGDTNHLRSLSRLEEEDKQTAQIVDSMGRPQMVIVVNESGIYALLFSMQPQKANSDGAQYAYPIEVEQRIAKLKDFRRWITHEVIPSIRQHGAYMTPETIEKVLADPDTIIQLATRLKAHQAELAAQDSYIKTLEPKAEFFDAVAGSKDAISIGDAAKVLDMGVGQNKLFNVLRREQILKDNNVPYQEYIDRGYFRVVEQKFVVKGETRISIKTLVSQRGLDYIRKMLQKRAVS